MARGTWGGTLDPSIFKVTFHFTLSSSKCQTSFYCRDRVINDNSPADVAATAYDTLQLGFRSLLSPQDYLERIDVIKLGSEDGATRILTPTEGQGATTSTLESKLPNFVVCNLAFKSEIRKRYGQGRMYLPVTEEAWIQQNLINAAGVTAMQAFVTPLTDNFLGDDISNDLVLVNQHPAKIVRGTPGLPGYRPALPASWYDVVSIRINTTATFLRSRRIGVGS